MLALAAGGDAMAQQGPVSRYVDCPAAVKQHRAFVTEAMADDSRKRTKLVPMPLLGGTYYCSEERFPRGGMVLPFTHEEGFLNGVRYRLDMTSSNLDIWTGADVKGRLRGPNDRVSDFKCMIFARRVLCTGSLRGPDTGGGMLDAFSEASVMLSWEADGTEVIISEGPAKPSDPPARISTGGRTWTIPWKTFTNEAAGGFPVTMARLKGPEADALIAAIARSKTITVQTRGGPAKVWPTGNAPNAIRVTEAVAAKLRSVVRWAP